MEFDRYTIALLILRPDAPELDEEAAAELQDAHMAHLADLHEQGHLLAAGPLSDEKFRGLTILNVEPERARALKEQDPAVQIGRFAVKVIPWMVPAGAMTFSRTRFPRSLAEANG
ncbi:MAG TPA: YciI family protein [Gaiellaceae bacterium]|nr:YciI family protein [Gaiellaceae bacterium]